MLSRYLPAEYVNKMSPNVHYSSGFLFAACLRMIFPDNRDAFATVTKKKLVCTVEPSIVGPSMEMKVDTPSSPLKQKPSRVLGYASVMHMHWQLGIPLLRFALTMQRVPTRDNTPRHTPMNQWTNISKRFMLVATHFFPSRPLSMSSSCQPWQRPRKQPWN